MPKRANSTGAPSKYPFSEMQVGDSLTIEPAPDEDAKEVRHRLCMAAVRWSKNNKLTWKFISQVVDGKARLFRTK